MAQLAAFISENYVKAAFMTTREIAAASGVSLTTVVRFPSLLGYADFDQLRESIQKLVKHDLTGVERLRTLPRHEDRSTIALLRRLVDHDIESLHALAQSFSEQPFERFCQMLVEANHVIIMGFRYIGPLVSYFGYSLQKIRPDVETWTQSDSVLYDRIRLMKATDVLVVIAFVPYPADLVALVRFAHQQQIHIVAITDSPLSPILPCANEALFVKPGWLDFVGSLAAPAALIHAIVTQVAANREDEARERLHALMDAAVQSDMYDRAATAYQLFRNHMFVWEQDEEDEQAEPQHTP
ncbi:MAG: MurR/RpiR family transcriptional regulator [Chloroflexaceae bacterium]|nr:MurR/RpiR family transcriptional regulator [Chloroflexaceae bacterium]